MHQRAGGKVERGDVLRRQRGSRAAAPEVEDAGIALGHHGFEHEASGALVGEEDMSGRNADFLHPVGNAFSERIAAELRHVRHLVAEALHADGHIQLRTARREGKVIYVLQPSGLLGDEQTHRFTDQERGFMIHCVSSFLISPESRVVERRMLSLQPSMSSVGSAFSVSMFSTSRRAACVPMSLAGT